VGDAECCEISHVEGEEKALGSDQCMFEAVFLILSSIRFVIIYYPVSRPIVTSPVTLSCSSIHQISMSLPYFLPHVEEGREHPSTHVKCAPLCPYTHAQCPRLTSFSDDSLQHSNLMTCEHQDEEVAEQHRGRRARWWQRYRS
jgi:hypothetical protein